MEDHQISGVWIAKQWTNILVDVVAAPTLRVVGVSITERILAGSAILIFFWGAYHLLALIHRKSVYWLAPWLAIVSYGFVFQAGLLNYYVSTGLVLWVIAIVWKRNTGWQYISPTLLILACLAHPLPVLWLAGAALYCWATAQVRWQFQATIFVLSSGLLYLVRVYVMTHYDCGWTPRQLLFVTGADQASLYGPHYLPIAVAILVFGIVLTVQGESRWLAFTRLPAQVYFLTGLAMFLLPTTFRASGQGAWAGLIAERLSLISAVLLFAIPTNPLPRKSYLCFGWLTALCFFALLFSNTGKASRIEAEMESLVNRLPFGQLVISYVPDLGTDDTSLTDRVRGRLEKLVSRLPRTQWLLKQPSRLSAQHLISRACIGHCFDYMNYEPSSGQFRLRARPGSSVVVADITESYLMQKGKFVVGSNGPPLYLIFRCGSEASHLCLGALPVGLSSVEFAARSR